MKRLFSLIGASFSQDMNLFRFKQKKNSPAGAILFAIFFMCIFGFYAEGTMQFLEPAGKQYLLITLYITGTTILTLIESIYKSQGILFSDKDINILFSLPIDKKVIVFLRMLKMIVFEFAYNSLFLLPAFVVYALHVKPDFSYYLIAILILVLSPIIPTVIGSILGYFVKYFSSKFQRKNLVQIVLTFIMAIGVCYISFSANNIMENLADNADNINTTITGIYYPIGLFINLVLSFNIIDLLIVLAINIIPLLLFVSIGGKFYFKVFFSLGKKAKVKELELNNKTFKANTPFMALVKKELRKFITSPILVINAYFGIILAVVIVIVGAINYEGFVEGFTSSTVVQDVQRNNENVQNEAINELIEESNNAPRVINAEGLNGVEKEVLAKLTDEELEEAKAQMVMIKEVANQLVGPILYCVIVVTSFMTYITANLISLEGKSITVTKSLPVSSSKILWAKVIASDLLVVPPLLLCTLIGTIRFGLSPIEILYLVLASILAPNLIAMYGLIVNLKHPKMQFASEAEVIKQSASVFICTFSGMFFSAFIIGSMFIVNPAEIAIFIELGIFVVLSLIMAKMFGKWGTNKLQKINV